MVFHRIAGAGPYGYYDKWKYFGSQLAWQLIKANVWVMCKFQTPASHSRPREK